MNWNRRKFLSTTISAPAIGGFGSLSIAPSHVAAAENPVSKWPTPEALYNGLLRPLELQTPPPSRIFGGDAKALIEAGTTPLPNENDLSRRYFAAFLKFGGPNKGRSSGRALPMLHPDKVAPEDSVNFYLSLLDEKSPAVSRKGKANCPWCEKPFGGLQMLVTEAPTFQTRCCRTSTEVEASVPVSSPLVIDEEFAAARWRLLIEQLSGVIATVLSDPDGKENPGAKAVLIALVKALPDYLERQPWQHSSRTDGRARRGDFPADALPESSQSLPPDEFPGPQEIEHFIEFSLAAPLESVLVEETEASLHRALFDRSELALLAEAFGAVVSELDADTKAKVTSALKRQFCLIRHLPQPGGNFPGYTVPMSLSIAIGSGDDALFQHLLEFVRHYLHNHFYDDGMSVEGAFNYAVMLSGFYLPAFRDRLGESAWAQLVERRPILARFEEIGCYPITTLHGIESQHGDEHLGFFRSINRVAKKAPNPDRSQNATSSCFPSYGIGSFRAGEPGAQLEAIMDYRSGVLHTHAARLNVQLFFEGVSLMPDLGYAAPAGLTDPHEVPEEIRSRLPLTEMRPWFTNALEMHCAPTIDGHQGNSPHGHLQAWFPGGNSESAGAGFHFMDVALPPENFETFPGDIGRCERQWMLVDLPGGASVAVSVCRLSGGSRHDLWWHFPAPAVEPCSPVNATADNLFDHLQETVATPPPFARDLEDRTGTFSLHAKKFGRGKELVYGEDSRELKQVRTWPASENMVDEHRWQIDPSSYVVGFERETEPWLQNPVEVQLWSATKGSPARKRYLGSRAPWPALVQLEKYKQRTICRDGALDVFTSQREATGDEPLESLFIDVLSARHPEKTDTPAVRSVRLLENELSDPLTHFGGGVHIETDSGASCLILTSGSSADRFQNKQRDAGLHGRVGKICPEMLEAVLIDGEYLRGHGFELILAPGWNVPLAGLVGDLTGHPDASALLISPDIPLPSHLVGTRLFVDHVASEAHQSCYEIASVAAPENGRQRINLAGSPPFALANLRVTKRSKNWIGVHEHQRFPPNRPVSENRIAYFPTADFTTRQTRANAGGSGRWSTHGIHFADDLPATIKPGDPVILYSIQPGDRVHVPSAFSCRRAGNQFLIESSGEATLTLPVPLRFSKVPEGIKIETVPNSTRLHIPAGKFALELLA
ncbi:hypothetical protein VSU19_18345 [Verrucomicrobiales bacterium BCK34]|nr:hypothetical protein [Verrucomicrobiales bacterium BCK34]